MLCVKSTAPSYASKFNEFGGCLLIAYNKGMKETHPVEIPKDSDKQGYKAMLDTLRDQLLKKKTISEAEVAPSPLETMTTAFNVAPVFPDGKKYFRIGEVADLIGVETYVLRYWESEFASIRPKKSRSGQRIYDRKDVQTLTTIHHLLHVERFSLEGAKLKMSEWRKAAKVQASQPPSRTVQVAFLQDLAGDLRNLINSIRTI